MALSKGESGRIKGVSRSGGIGHMQAAALPPNCCAGGSPEGWDVIRYIYGCVT